VSICHASATRPFIIGGLADIRLANTAALFDEFESTAVVGPAGDELKGLEARFAEQLRISASYWSQLKREGWGPQGFHKPRSLGSIPRPATNRLNWSRRQSI